MVDSTFQALVVGLLALVPGGLYIWAFEREAGDWGVGLGDRLLRFVGASAILHALAAPLTYELYRVYVRSGALADGDALPPWIWVVPLLYVGVPVIAGSIVGNATQAHKRWARFLTGRSPAPRAWDYLFSTGDLEGWVRLKLADGGWILGAYAKEDEGGLRSYAAGFPQVQDLYLAETVECDPETGWFLLDEDGNTQPRGVGVLVRWDQVAYLEFIQA